MEKLLLAIFLITISFNSFGQDSASVESKSSKLSFGIMPIFLVEGSDFANDGQTNPGGFGLEINVINRFNDHFSGGAFLGYSNVFNWSILSGNSNERRIEQFVSVGVLLEYKIFKKLGFQLRAGREGVDIPNGPSYIYGCGVSLYLNPSKSFKVVNSFNFIVYKSNNHSYSKWNHVNSSYQSTFYNAIICQIGWRIQIHEVKNKK